MPFLSTQTPARKSTRRLAPSWPGEAQGERRSASTLRIRSRRRLLAVDRLAGLDVLGRAGTFPAEAINIAATGAKATPNQFDPVEEKAGALQDWFAFKGFDNFRILPEFAQFDVVGVRIFQC